ncbi:MAG: hypothetical protein GQ531_08395 [Sulfurovum sp.]|nr:hypothetical protein [Sulfurovum sp.]
MIHGHQFDFINEPCLNTHGITLHAPSITVIASKDLTLLERFPLKSPWVQLSGREGQYLSRVAFNEADEYFSWALRIKDVLTLIWLPEEQTIMYIKDSHYSPELLQFWIFHTFFPLVLDLNKRYHFLHVGAVETEGKTIFFSALSFGAKSTLTDYFIQQGATLVSDDALGIEEKDGQYMAIPAYPFHRPYRKPEELGHKVEKFAQEAKSISAIFLLKKG